jgi:hypothetical protein
VGCPVNLLKGGGAGGCVWGKGLENHGRGARLQGVGDGRLAGLEALMVGCLYGS